MKRYDKSTLLYLASCYVESERTYRQVVQIGAEAIEYYPPTASEGQERWLRHSTVWRMLTWMGGQQRALAVGQRLLAAQDPSCTCHRFVGAVAPNKFRSPQRQRCLRNARKLLDLLNRWARTFAEPFFPRFATRAGFD